MEEISGNAPSRSSFALLILSRAADEASLAAQWLSPAPRIWGAFFETFLSVIFLQLGGWRRFRRFGDRARSERGEV